MSPSYLYSLCTFLFCAIIQLLDAAFCSAAVRVPEAAGTVSSPFPCVLTCTRP